MTLVRIGLVSARPLPPALVEHARGLLAGLPGSPPPEVLDTSRRGWFSVAITGQHDAAGSAGSAGSVRSPGAAGPAGAASGTDVSARLAAELRAPATALAVDSAVTAGALAADGVGLLVMDVDSTLITAEVIELLAEHAGSREQVADITERAMRGELDFAASLRERVATLAGLAAEPVIAAVREAVELSAGARELVDTVRAGGGKVALVSGGFAEIVQPLAAELGVDHVAANRLEVDGGRLTGRTSGPVIDRAAKEHYLRQWAEEGGMALDRVVAVGDGANDLDMLAAAGLGIAYCAKPVVQEQADAAVTFPRLDAVLGLLGH